MGEENLEITQSSTIVNQNSSSEMQEIPEISPEVPSQTIRFSQMEFDALKETANIGTGNASIALSNIFKRRVNITLPDLKVSKLAEVINFVSGPKDMVVGIYSQIKEGMDGSIIMVMPFDVALEITKVFSKDKTPKTTIDENEKALLQKVGTATYMSYLNSLAKFFKNKITFDPPNVITSFGASIFDFMTLNVESDEDVLMIKLGFDIESTNVKGDFMLLFTLESLAPLMQNIHNLVPGTETVVEPGK